MSLLDVEILEKNSKRIKMKIRTKNKVKCNINKLISKTSLRFMKQQ